MWVFLSAPRREIIRGETVKRDNARAGIEAYERGFGGGVATKKGSKIHSVPTPRSNFPLPVSAPSCPCIPSPSTITPRSGPETAIFLRQDARGAVFSMGVGSKIHKLGRDLAAAELKPAASRIRQKAAMTPPRRPLRAHPEPRGEVMT